MKTLLSFLFLAVFSVAAFADIQEPPVSLNNPVRKFGRGLSNVVLGISEIPYTLCINNEINGNNSFFAGYSKAIWRSAYRTGKGAWEVAMFPIPVYKGSYRSPYRSDVLYGTTGFSEFPPELGFETRYRYCRTSLQ